jgi:hypothetical protein
MKEDKIATHCRDETCKQNFTRKIFKDETDHLGDPGIDARIILNWILKKQDMTGFFWLRLDTVGKPL